MATYDHIFTSQTPMGLTFRQMDPYDSQLDADNIRYLPIDPYDVLTGNTFKNVMRDAITRSVTQSSLSHNDIVRTISYCMDSKIISYKDQQMCRTPFGLNVTHNLTMEDPANLKEFEFVYMLNRTSPARQVSLNNTPPEVTVELIVRKVELENPIVVSFSMKSDLYKAMKAALENIEGLGLKDNLKIYVGQQGYIPQTLLWQTALSNYIQKINLYASMAALSISQGETQRQLQYIYSRSPPVTTMPVKDCYKVGISNKEWAVYLIRAYSEHMFGVNKLWKVKRERSSVSDWLNEVCRIFELNTNSVLQPELAPYFENCPFKNPKGVITCTENIREALIQCKRLKTAYNSTMVQKISYCQISKNDTHPFDTKAPHDMVTLSNGNVYRRNPNGGLLTTEVRTENYDTEYIEHGGGAYVVSCIRDGDFGSDNTVLKAGLKQITRFDEFIPCGFEFTSSFRDPDDFHHLYSVPQTTYFKDCYGTTRSLSVSNCASWLKSIYARYFKEFKGSTQLKTSSVFTKGEKWEPEKPWDDFKDLSNNLPFFYVSTDGKELKCFDLVIENHWMTKGIFLSNLLTTYKYSTENLISPQIQEDAIPTDDEVDPTPGQSGGTTTQQRSESTTQFRGAPKINPSPDAPIRSIFFKDLYADQNAFKTEIIMAAYKELGYSDNPALMTDQVKMTVINKLENAYDYLINLKNEQYDNFLNEGINPGVAVMWIKPQFCESDSMIISKPAGFTNISANPSLKKQLDLKDDSDQIMFTFGQSSAHCINGISNTSVKVPSAMMVQKLFDDTEMVVNPMGKDAKVDISTIKHIGLDDYLLKMTRRDKCAKFWPVLWNPKAPISIMETGVSPIGRCTTQWTDSKTFEKQFYDPEIADCLYPNNFTVNTGCTDMRFNMNTLFYPKDILSQSECPLNKYFKFNRNSTKAIMDLQRNHARRSALKTNGFSANQSSESSTPCYPDDSDVARIVGVCFAKRCYTHPELLKQEDQNKKPTIYPSRSVIQSKDLGHHFFYPGNDALEKFDQGIPFSSFST